jgi:lysine N6-hydroxylase
VDTLVLATGFEQRLPPALRPLEPRLHRSAQGLAMARDYSLEWDGPRGLRIYLQNGARGRRGIADPNLSLVAWRGAVICNSLAERPYYDVSDRPDLYAEAR